MANASKHLGLVLVTGLMLSACARSPEVTFDSATLVSLVDDDLDGVVNARDVCAETQMGLKIDNDGCPTDVYNIITVDLKLLFDNNSSYLNKHYIQELANFAEDLKQSRDVNIELEGHTSAVGDLDYNQYLSHKRATRVMNILVDEYNVDASRLAVVAFGESKLAIQGDNEINHSLNRRVVAHIQAHKEEDYIRWHSYSKEILDLID